MALQSLDLHTFSGTAYACGAAYGETFEPLIIGLCQQDAKPDERRLEYAARCWACIEKYAPASARFMRGMAAGARLPLDFVTLLTAWEEVGAHFQPHCTAFVATAPATEAGRTLNGQNWDFASAYSPWPGLLKLRLQDGLGTLSYHFPGLWNCAGVNEAGLTLTWCSAGCYPAVPAETGVPAYVLMAEILQQKTVAEALHYLREVRIAGAFIALLGDAGGDIAVVEALPGYAGIDRSGPILCRANHYCGAEAGRLSAQDLSGGILATAGTVPRHARMSALLQQHAGSVSPAVAQRILTDREGPWPWIHQFPAGAEGRQMKLMTIDSLLFAARDRVLYTCRGGRNPGPWRTVEL